jgi:hypothetical protein
MGNTENHIVRSSILKVLVYFDLFDYPVSREEIQLFMDRPSDRKMLAEMLDQLVEEGCLFRAGDFFSLRDDPSLAEKRRQGNLRAEKLLKRAWRISRLLYQFPFVRGISISGSLSKNFASETADIDYFIVTASNRLWVARTLMHILKKLSFLVNRQHWFCMNYYVDTCALEIEEKNLFTATEILTLKLFAGRKTQEGFLEANHWVGAIYPHYRLKNTEGCQERSDAWLKKGMERILGGRLGERLDQYLCRLTTSRWQVKERKNYLNARGGRLGIRTGRHYCKPNPEFLQKNILSGFHDRLAAWDQKWNAYRIQGNSSFFFKEMI